MEIDISENIFIILTFLFIFFNISTYYKYNGNNIWVYIMCAWKIKTKSIFSLYRVSLCHFFFFRKYAIHWLSIATQVTRYVSKKYRDIWYNSIIKDTSLRYRPTLSTKTYITILKSYELLKWPNLTRINHFLNNNLFLINWC